MSEEQKKSGEKDRNKLADEELKNVAGGTGGQGLPIPPGGVAFVSSPRRNDRSLGGDSSGGGELP